MELNRQWRGWRTIERIALGLGLVACTFVASQPLWERLVAWRSQRALEVQWQQAQKSARSSEKKPHKKAVSHARSQADWASSSRGTLPPVEDDNETALWPVTRLSCLKMKLDAVVVEGTDEKQLQSGPGHEVGTSWPGGENCVIAAHRNAYGWWFYNLNLLKKGDPIVLQIPGRKLTYHVVATRMVSVRDTSILRWRPNTPSRLTLYTCTLPKTTQRLVVVANLQSSQTL